jgi:pyruvate/2-oxoglutarate dehydrogenase complex dihydrolipoamide acyltransferase (E2) component
MPDVFVPKEHVNDESVIVKAVYANSGDFINKGQIVLEIETSKTNISIDAPEDGFISHKLKSGAELGIGELMFSVHDESVKPESSELSLKSTLKPDSRLSKAATARALELGIDFAELPPKWLSVDDIEVFAGVKNPIQKNVSFDVARQPHPLVNLDKKVITKRKRAEIKNLEVRGGSSTSSTIGIDIKVPGKRIVSPPYIFEESISDVLIFEAAKLLKNYPELNATYLDDLHWGCYKEVNFGWSFDNGANLKVLAVKNTDKLSLLELQAEIIRLLELYESDETIPIELLTSSTVTFSDLSRTEASFMIPLLNGLQSLIIGIVKRAKNDYSIFATFDHRVSEGLQVANFLFELKTRILSHYFSDQGYAKVFCDVCEKSMSEEISLGNHGFIQVMRANGLMANICKTCFEGW